MTDSISEKGAFHSPFLHHLGGCFVYFFRRDSRPNDCDHAIEDVAGDTAS